MMLKLAIYACLGVACMALVLKAPIHKREAYRSRLLKESEFIVCLY